MKMYLNVILLVVLVLALVYLGVYYADILLTPKTKQNAENQVCFGSNCFVVELAKTTAEQEKGLMNRTELDANKGMLFIFNNEGVYQFWMKNTLIPLDMIWMDGNNKIVFMAQNIQPCKTMICPNINPLVNANYVLEINAGVAAENGIKTGDVATIKIK